MKSDKVTPSPDKFIALRAKYLEKRRALDVFDIEMHSKYGPKRDLAWLSRGEKRRWEKHRLAADKAASVFYDYLTKISPRDWSYGVPTYWLYESLTYEDAVRPANEPLSVVPPLSLGSTVPRT